MDTGDSDIRVSFTKWDGCWSMVGKDCRSTSRQKPTMNLDLSNDSSDDTFSRKVLHEFGHALGYIHEGQNQSAHIQSNREVVHGYYGQDGVDLNVSSSRTEVTTDFLALNLSSIMLYPISGSLTDRGYAAGCKNSPLAPVNSTISKYNPQDDNLAVGHFQTNNDWTKVDPGGINSGIISRGSAYADPRVVLGLDMIDLGGTHGHNHSIKSYVDNVTKEKFAIHLDTWADCRLFNAGVSWLKLPADNPNIQFGVFNSLDVRSSNEPGNVHARITFSHPFPRQPMVFAGLNGFDIGDDWHIELSRSNIDCYGFDIHIGTWGNSKLRSAQATWIAFQSDRSDIFTGELRGDESRAWQGSLHLTSSFNRTPAIFTALTKFDVERCHNNRIRLKTSATKMGMNWEIVAWADTKIYQVRAAYLLIDL